MFSHIVVGADDVAASKAFYDAVLGVLGVQPGTLDARGRALYMKDGLIFLVTPPINGAPATHANGGTIGFSASSPEQVDAWHAAGVTHGGTPIENPPGVRENPLFKLYLAYLRDPAGNKLCATHRMG
ncbi:VOC family protein [Sphingobium nicotianae]|uniref:VOC family protein n=1 Tax=Sphingobium nicotianae TaxID=2782607 RepID=A0A9X1IS94_9SPHN|nr:VOC family protein [Sphingobium nicotianae]MBT2188187.1 VOC family protein [Sphingobium nicotianae]